MKNQDKWQSSRIEKKNNDFQINTKAFSIASRYIGNIVVKEYSAVINDYASGSLLDCGCGQVPYYEMYKDLVTKVTCVDWEVSNPENDYLDFTADLNKPLVMMETESFDTVLLADVLEHIYYPQQLFSELNRVLIPNGKLIVFVPYYYWLHGEPHDYFRYTEHALSRFCEDNNLKVLKLEPYGGYFDVLFDLIDKYFINSEFGFKMLQNFANFIKKTKYYNKRLPDRIRSFPLGYTLVAEKIGREELR